MVRIKRLLAFCLAMLFCIAVGAGGMWLYIQRTSELRIGFVDIERLAAMREDYPGLAKKVIAQASPDSPYAIVITRNSLVWARPKGKVIKQDLTDKFLPKIKILAATSEYDPKNPPFSKEELEHAKQAMAALDEMRIAVGVGLNIMDYRERLTDTLVKAKSHMPEFPPSDLKTEMGRAWEIYGKAGEIWQQTYRYEYTDILARGETGDVIKEFKIPVNLKNLGEFTKIEESQRTTILQSLWSAADTHIENAAYLLSKKTSKKQP